MDELNKIIKLKKTVQELLKLKKKHMKLIDIDTSDLTRNRIYNIRNDKEIVGAAIETLYHELHCLGVELSFAKKEEWRYHDIQSSGHWNQSLEYRRKPII